MSVQHNTAEQAVETVMTQVSRLSAALRCDFQGLEQWLDERRADDIIRAAEDAEPERVARLNALIAQAGNFSSAEEVVEAIRDSALACEVRSAWKPCGDKLRPYEFRIFLAATSTDVELYGELDQFGRPCTARLRYKTYGRPEVEYRGEKLDTAALLDFAACFNFKT